MGQIKCEHIASSELRDENRREPPTAGTVVHPETLITTPISSYFPSTFNRETDIEKPIDRNQYSHAKKVSLLTCDQAALLPFFLWSHHSCPKKEDLIAGYNISDLSIVIESLKTYYFFFSLCI